MTANPPNDGSNRPASRFDRPATRPGRGADRPQGDRSGSGRGPGDDRSRGPRQGGDRPRNDRSFGDRPAPSRGYDDRRPREDRPDRGPTHRPGGLEPFRRSPMPPPADLLTGIHPVLALLRWQPDRVREVLLWSTDPRLQAQVREAAAAAKITVHRVDPPDFDDDPGNPQGVAARVGEFRYTDLEDLIPLQGVAAGTLVLVLDSITDPRNLGSILRSAAFFGVQGVILPTDRAAGITPLVERIARGATATIPVVRVVNLARTLEILKERGFFAIGTALEPGSGDLATFRFPPATALVLGAEGTGLRPLVRKRCDEVVKLSAFGNMQSLNVSSFATLALQMARSQLPVPGAAG